MAGYEHKFHRSSADVTIRSRDGIDFRVHKLVLSEGSSVFADIFSLPTPMPTYTTAGISLHQEDGAALVQLEEDSKTIDTLLGFLYPGMGPRVEDLSCLTEVLKAADKYDMEGVRSVVKNDPSVAMLGEDDPWRLFAIAVRFGLADAAKAAAQRTLLLEPLPLDSHLPEFDLIPASAYRALLVYRQKHVDLFETVLERTLDILSMQGEVDPAAFRCRTCAGSGSEDALAVWFEGHTQRLRARVTQCALADTIVSLPALAETCRTLSRDACKTCRTVGPPYLLFFSVSMKALWEEEKEDQDVRVFLVCDSSLLNKYPDKT